MKYILIIIIFLLSSTDVYGGALALGWSESNNQLSKSYLTTIDFSEEDESLELMAHYEYGKINNEVNNDAGYINILYDREILKNKWALWFNGYFGYDKSLCIDTENKIGAGIKYYFIKKKILLEDDDFYWRKFSLSGGGLYHFVSERDPITGEITNIGNGRYSIRLKYTDNIFKFIYFYQPSMDDNDDYITKYISSVVLLHDKEIKSKLEFFYNGEYRSLRNVKNTKKGCRLVFKF